MNQTRTDPQGANFMDSIREGNEKDFRRILLENANNNDKLNLLLTKKYGQFKQTALQLAAKYAREEMFTLLLKYGPDIHATDLHKCTVLHIAADKNEGINIVTAILRCEGVDVNAKDGYGNTPVKLAAEKGNSGAVRLLINKRADLTIADQGENTALHVAAKCGHIDVLKLLLEELAHKGIIGKQNKDKNTPLHLAVESKSKDCVALLLNSGATSTMAVKNQHDQTAADLAKEQSNQDISKLLENPQKARELFQEKPKPANTALAQFGRGCSVDADSPATNSSYQMKLSAPQEVMQQLNQNGALQVQVNAENLIIHQQFSATVTGGNVAMGPNSRVGDAPDPTAVAGPQPLPVFTGESHYDVNVTGGNASIGDNPTTNVGTAEVRTPSTAGSSDIPFNFQLPRENKDTSTGFATGTHPSGESSGSPAENPSPFDETAEKLSHPRVNSSRLEELCASLHSMSPQTETKGDVTPARNHSLTGETASSDAVEASKTVSNSEPPDESEAFNANPGGTSFKPSAALGQTWQQNIGSGSQRNASPMTRSVPKEVQDRLKKKVRNSPPSEILGLDEFCAVPESQKRSEDMELQSEEQQWADAVTKEKVAGSGDDTLHRAPLVKGSGPASLVAFAASPKSDVEPKRCASVAQNTASCNAGACNYESSLDGAACGLNSSSPSARCSSSSKESSHRKERPCRENAIPDGTLPSGHGASADGTKSIRTSRNDGAVRAGNHKQSADSRNNLSSEARSSTAGDPSVIVLMPKDADPDHDPKDHEKCEPGCCLM